jgi:hypothetical protein
VEERLVTLVEAWDTTWAPLPALVFEGSGCAPCLATHQGILLRLEGTWTVLPWSEPPREEERGERSPGWSSTPRIRLAVEGGRVYAARGDGATLAWEGAAWRPASHAGPWAQELRGIDAGAQGVRFATSEALLVVGGPGGFAWRA